MSDEELPDRYYQYLTEEARANLNSLLVATNATIKMLNTVKKDILEGTFTAGQANEIAKDVSCVGDLDFWKELSEFVDSCEDCQVKKPLAPIIKLPWVNNKEF